jgi:hypothetical protein
MYARGSETGNIGSGVASIFLDVAVARWFEDGGSRMEDGGDIDGTFHLPSSILHLPSANA